MRALSPPVQTPPIAPPADVPEDDHPARFHDRFPLFVFLFVLVGAVPLYLYLGRRQWFFLDEWDFLAGRGLNAHDLLRPHNEHWSTIPVIVYRVLFHLFGLRSY